MTHQDVADLAPEFVLGTLDEVSQARVTSHLSACPQCRAEVAAVSQTFDALGRSVDEAVPPAGLRDRIVRVSAELPQASAATTTAPSRSARGVDVWLRLAAAVIVGVALWQWNAARQEVATLQARVAELQVDAQELLVARASLAQLEAQVRAMTHQAQVLRASDMLSYTLDAHDPARGAHARAYVSHKNGMVFTADGLPQVPTGKVYQLWIIVDAKPISVGVFTPDATGNVYAVMDTPSISVMPTRVAVTLEPAGGLPQPSGTVYLDGAL